jgi:hypothetical protein
MLLATVATECRDVFTALTVSSLHNVDYPWPAMRSC